MRGGEVSTSLFETGNDRPTVTSLLPWFGSKRTLAPRIVKELGPHRAYVEPFCGSMAVLLAKPTSVVEIANDLHEDLINLARVLRDPFKGPMFLRRVRRWSFHAGVVDDAKAALQVATTEIDRAVAYFAMNWLGLNGFTGTSTELTNVNECRRYTLLGGGYPTKRWESASSSMLWIRKRLKPVDIRSEDAFRLLERIADVPGQVFYVDPPYLTKGASYRHDFARGDHDRLASILRRFTKSRVIVSYYADPDLSALYPGWTVVDCSLSKALVSQGKRDAENGAKAPEVLLINGPSYTHGGTTNV